MKKHVMPIVCAGVLLYGTAHATIWYVHPDSTLNSIQAGLDSCATNDTVLVGPGTYYENIWWPTTLGINLISELGRDSTIIDGQQAGRVIFIAHYYVDKNGLINGFTIQNGSTDQAGSGIHCCADSFTISNNIITNNESYGSMGRGGGISTVSYKTLFIHDNIISNNSAPMGGGIYLSMSGAVFVNNVITGNTATQCGGILCRNNSRPIIIRDNIISFNSTPYATGGGIWLDDASATITRNFIAGNQASEGAGICLWNWSSATIDSNVISNNIGSGITCNRSSPIINYNDIWGNTGYGVENEDSTIIVNAEYNWWGDESGPFHPDSNPFGFGDSVSDFVDFIPWLDGPMGMWEKPVVNPVNKHTDIGSTIINGPLLLPEGKNCRVFDITGRVVLPQHIKPGIYFIEVDGEIRQKVVKIR